MSAHKIDIISRASQGNPKAISDLLNRALAPKNIVVRAKLMQDCLTIFAEGKEVPDQLSLVGVIRRGINDLSIDSLASVKVYGKLSGETSSSWSETIQLKEEALSPQTGVAPQTGSASLDWANIQAKATDVYFHSLKIGKKLLQNKRLVFGSLGFAALILVTIGGVVGVNAFQTRSQGRQAIQTAQVLVQDANATAASGTSELTAASEKLSEAISVLEAVPDARWSLYDQAQAEIEEISTALQQVERRLEVEESATSIWESANRLAVQAIEFTSAPPYSIEDWEIGHRDLSRAVELLGTIARGSSYAGQAQEKLAEYQEKLSWMEGGMANERTAIAVLQSADETAQRAYRSTSGRSRFQVAELTEAKDIWQEAVDQVKDVPPTSNAYRQVSDRLSLFSGNIGTLEEKIQTMNECQARSTGTSTFCNIVIVRLQSPPAPR